jgi:AcrR family transcriptional regulator
MGSNGSAHAEDAARLTTPRLLAPATQRERLLDAMAQTVSDRGYATTSVADVLKVARISRRTFYEQFIDKEDCFLAAYEEIATLCNERVVAAYRTETSWEDGLARGYETFLNVLAAEPSFARLAIVEVLAAGPRALSQRDETLRRFARFVESLRVQADVTAPPPELVAQAIGGGIYELVYSRLVRQETSELPGLAGELLHFTFMLLGVERRTV